MGARAFSVKEGAALGPFHLEEGWALVKVLRVDGATLDDKTRATIADALFTEWLDSARTELPVERLYRT
jgi:parvulin-like peptidyl-prolyl isomerase